MENRLKDDSSAHVTFLIAQSTARVFCNTLLTKLLLGVMAGLCLFTSSIGIWSWLIQRQKQAPQSPAVALIVLTVQPPPLPKSIQLHRSVSAKSARCHICHPHHDCKNSSSARTCTKCQKWSTDIIQDLPTDFCMFSYFGISILRLQKLNIRLKRALVYNNTNSNDMIAMTPMTNNLIIYYRNVWGGNSGLNFFEFNCIISFLFFNGWISIHCLCVSVMERQQKMGIQMRSKKGTLMMDWSCGLRYRWEV